MMCANWVRNLGLVLSMAILVILPLASEAAVQGEVDDKFLIPVPKEQRKIAVGNSKEFADGTFSVTVERAERSLVTLSIGDGEPVSFGNSVQTLIANGDEVCTVVYLGLSGSKALVSARCDPATEDLQAALEAQLNAEPVEIVDPIDLIADAEIGALKNPYLGNTQAITEGHKLFLNNSCNGCHGGTGGGGMGPALSNGVWVYGLEDDTLFRLVTMGTDGLQADGFSRVAQEKVVGPMPPYKGIITNSDELWKILAWVRSVSSNDAPPLQE